MSCNCNQNRRWNGCNCGMFGRAQHIRVNQCASTVMGNGPCCCRHAYCCKCCQCQPQPSQPTIDYACLRRAEKEFERKVANCMGLCGYEDETCSEENDSSNPYVAFANKCNENEE